MDLLDEIVSISENKHDTNQQDNIPNLDFFNGEMQNAGVDTNQIYKDLLLTDLFSEVIPDHGN